MDAPKKYARSWDNAEAKIRKEIARGNPLLPMLEMLQELRKRGYDDSIIASSFLESLTLKHPPHPKLHVRLMTGGYNPQKHPMIFITVDIAAPIMNVTARLNGQRQKYIMSPIAMNAELIAMLDALSNHSYDYLYEHITLHPEDYK